MPLIARNSHFAIRGVRIFRDDLLDIHRALEKAAHACGANQHASISVTHRGADHNQSLADPEELSRYTPGDLDRITMMGAGVSFTVNLQNQELRVGLHGHASNQAFDDLIVITRRLPLLPAPGRWAYLFRRQHLNPHRIELHLTDRAETSVRRVDRARHSTNVAIATVSAAFGAVGGVAAVLALHH